MTLIFESSGMLIFLKAARALSSGVCEVPYALEELINPGTFVVVWLVPCFEDTVVTIVVVVTFLSAFFCFVLSDSSFFNL